jgi:hypothetical protein
MLRGYSGAYIIINTTMYSLYQMNTNHKLAKIKIKNLFPKTDLW